MRGLEVGTVLFIRLDDLKHILKAIYAAARNGLSRNSRAS